MEGPRRTCALHAIVSLMSTSSLQDTVGNLLSMYPTLIEDLSHRRSAQINEASELGECAVPMADRAALVLDAEDFIAVEVHTEERQDSRKKLIHLAKARADEILERQKVRAFSLGLRPALTQTTPLASWQPTRPPSSSITKPCCSCDQSQARYVLAALIHRPARSTRCEHSYSAFRSVQ